MLGGLIEPWKQFANNYTICSRWGMVFIYGVDKVVLYKSRRVSTFSVDSCRVQKRRDRQGSLGG